METECTIWWVARSIIGQNRMSWTGLQFLRMKKSLEASSELCGTENDKILKKNLIVSVKIELQVVIHCR